MLNGRLAEKDHCLRPLSQRGAIAIWSMLKNWMSLSLRRILSQTAKPQVVLVLVTKGGVLEFNGIDLKKYQTGKIKLDV